MKDNEITMTEEQREQALVRAFRRQRDYIEQCKVFRLMGYSVEDTHEAMVALHYPDADPQKTEFVCVWIDEHKNLTLDEMNAAMWKFLWEMEPPEIPKTEEGNEDAESEQKKRLPIEEYACRVVFLNLLTDRIEYLRSLMRGGYAFEDGWKETWVNCGYEPHYIMTLRAVIEEHPGEKSRELAQIAYKILYKEELRTFDGESGFLYCCDRIDLEGMMKASRERLREALGRKVGYEYDE